MSREQSRERLDETAERLEENRALGSIKSVFTKGSNTATKLVEQINFTIKEVPSESRTRNANALLAKINKAKSIISDYKEMVSNKVAKATSLNSSPRKGEIIQKLIEHCEEQGYKDLQTKVEKAIADISKITDNTGALIFDDDDEELSEDGSDLGDNTIIQQPRTVTPNQPFPATNPSPIQNQSNSESPRTSHTGSETRGRRRSRTSSGSLKEQENYQLKARIDKQDQILENIQTFMQTISAYLPKQSTQAELQGNKDPVNQPKNIVPEAQPENQVLHVPTVRDLIESIDDFDGSDPENYPEFINQFKQQVHNNMQLAVQTKYSILKKLLKGDARELVTTTNFAEEDYTMTLELLESTYMLDRQPVLMDKFRNKQIHPSDYAEMEKDIIKLVSLSNQLILRKVDVNHPMVIDELIKKLPADIMTFIVKKNRNQTNTFKEVILMIREKINEQRFVDNAKQLQKRNTEITEVCAADSGPKPNPTKSNKNRSSNNKADPKNTDFTCKYCSEKHATGRCPRTPAEKRKIIKDKKLCSNCLASGHVVKDCPSKFTCYYCHQKHHSGTCDNHQLMTEMGELSQQDRDKIRAQFFRAPQ